MLRRIAGWFALWVVALFALTAATTPSLLRRINGRIDIPLDPPSRSAAELHQDLLVADLHADSLLWPRDLLERSSDGQVDIPRLLEGNVAVQVFSVVTKVPKGQNNIRNRGNTDVIELLAPASGWPPRTWNSPYERALYQAEKFEGLVARSNRRLVQIRTAQELDRFLASRRTQVGGVLALEGVHMLEGDLSRLERLFERGYRMAGLTHFFDNSVAGSTHGWNKGGLTEFGKTVVRRMEALGMIIDLAHTSPKTIEDVLDIATRPVVVSHTGVRGTCESRRNLDDRQIRRIAENGGVIGIGFWRGAICEPEPAAVARAARYVADQVGVRHVGLGSDFDGAVSTAFDASELSVLTHAFLDAGFTAEEVRALMGGNVLALLRRGLP
ncbi:MAG: dipeptidase [Myxococcota bacterium]